MGVIHRSLAATSLFALFSISSIANGALIERLGGQAYYDDVLDITWIADGNYAMNGPGGSYNGTMTWLSVNNWVNNLEFNGITGWRLPTALDTGAAGKDYSYSGTDTGYNVQTTDGTTVYSEMASLYYDTLGNIAAIDVNGDTPAGFDGTYNSGPFTDFGNIASYWVASATDPTSVANSWVFAVNGSSGAQLDPYNYGSFAAMVVHDGDISAVPVPAAVWLFGSGLIGLSGLAKRKKG